MKEKVWGYTIEHNKEKPLNRYDKARIKEELRIGFKRGWIEKKNETITWKVEGYTPR